MGRAMKTYSGALGAAWFFFFVLPAGKAAQQALPAPTPRPVRASQLFAPSVRRSAQSYLRLRLLELREADLDRARLVIEHKLGIDALLETPAPVPKDATRRNKP
jgi:hypothetical protein